MNHDNIVVTHSDIAEVLVWDFSRQEDSSRVRTTDGSALRSMTNAGCLYAWPCTRGERAELPGQDAWFLPAQGSRGKLQDAQPDLVLAGHTKPAPFALASSDASPTVASGGEDCNVLVWNLADHGGILSRGAEVRQAESLRARATLQGHRQTVTDVCFKPGTDSMLVSTSDDGIIRFWDTRQQGPTHSVRCARRATDSGRPCSVCCARCATKAGRRPAKQSGALQRDTRHEQGTGAKARAPKDGQG